MAGFKRNAGGIALARTGKQNTEIAAALGRTKPTVGRWISGERKPTDEDRKKIREVFGIAEDLWDQAPAKRTPPAAQVEAAPLPDAGPDAGPDDTPAAMFGKIMTMARRLEGQVESELEDLEKDRAGGASTPAERTRRIREMTAAVKTLAEVTGQLDLGRMILKLPVWKKIEAEIFDVLKAYPEAAKQLAERFESLDRRLG